MTQRLKILRSAWFVITALAATTSLWAPPARADLTLTGTTHVVTAQSTIDHNVTITLHGDQAKVEVVGLPTYVYDFAHNAVSVLQTTNKTYYAIPMTRVLSNALNMGPGATALDATTDSTTPATPIASHPVANVTVSGTVEVPATTPGQVPPQMTVTGTVQFSTDLTLPSKKANATWPVADQAVGSNSLLGSPLNASIVKHGGIPLASKITASVPNPAGGAPLTMITTWTVTAVSTDAVTDAGFGVPDGYTMVEAPALPSAASASSSAQQNNNPYTGGNYNGGYGGGRGGRGGGYGGGGGRGGRGGRGGFGGGGYGGG
jgi:hypothetical protein